MSEDIILNKRYKLEERLGSGGMAVVYRAVDLMLERNVAIKVLREDYSQDQDFRERFKQEARAAANLSHPNIVTVHDFGLDSERLFIVMELVPGDHLKNILKKRWRFSIGEALTVAVQACAGIGYAHRAGLVHCDVKPHNILITPDQRLKVTDFGIARALASIRPEERSEVVWGSPQYFSPEQAAGNAPSPASDVYSLGVILFEMLTGRLPFEADSAAELARMHREMPPPTPSQYNPAIPTTLDQILIKVLSKEPSARYRTADQFGRILVTFGQNSNAETSVLHTEFSELLPPPVTRPTTVRSEPRRSDPAPQPAPRPAPQQRETGPKQERATNPLDIDWMTIGLGLLALIAVGGLIPLYLWLFYLYR